MRHVYEGVKAVLKTNTNLQRVFIADPGPDVPVMPYIILWGPGAAVSSEPNLCMDDSFDDSFWVKVVAGTGEATFLGAEIVKGLLDRVSWFHDGAGNHGQTVPGATHRVETVFELSNPIQVDRDVFVPNTNRHPCFIDLRFRAWSEPI